jgi:mono/diheme cytochrome c family protein
VSVAVIAWSGIGIGNPHPPMPKFDLTRTEIDDIIAYINSLKRE